MSSFMENGLPQQEPSTLPLFSINRPFFLGLLRESPLFPLTSRYVSHGLRFYSNIGPPLLSLRAALSRTLFPLRRRVQAPPQKCLISSLTFSPTRPSDRIGFEVFPCREFSQFNGQLFLSPGIPSRVGPRDRVSYPFRGPLFTEIRPQSKGNKGGRFRKVSFGCSFPLFSAFLFPSLS